MMIENRQALLGQRLPASMLRTFGGCVARGIGLGGIGDFVSPEIDQPIFQAVLF
jgi:hypothetical protein